MTEVIAISDDEEDIPYGVAYSASDNRLTAKPTDIVEIFDDDDAAFQIGPDTIHQRQHEEHAIAPRPLLHKRYLSSSILANIADEALRRTQGRPRASDHLRSPRPKASDHGRSPRPKTGDHGRSPRPKAGDHGRSPRPKASNHGRSPRPKAGDQGRSPRPKASDHGRSPRPKAGDHGRSPRPEAGDHRRSPRPKASDHGRSPRPKAGDHGRSPRPKASDHGRSPRPKAGDQGRSPRSEAGDQGCSPMVDRSNHQTYLHCLQKRPRIDDSQNNFIPQVQIKAETDITDVPSLDSMVSPESHLPPLQLDELSRKSFYQCCVEACDFNTVSPNVYHDHLLTNHCDMKFFACVHCGFTVNTVPELLRHLRKHVVDTWLDCNYRHCRFTSNNMDDYIRHVHLTHYAEERHVCLKCSEHFDCVLQLIQHMQTTSIRISKCPHCSCKDTSRDRIKEHIHSFHSLKESTVSTSRYVLCKERTLNRWPTEIQPPSQLPPMLKRELSQNSVQNSCSQDSNIYNSGSVDIQCGSKSQSPTSTVPDGILNGTIPKQANTECPTVPSSGSCQETDVSSSSPLVVESEAGSSSIMSCNGLVMRNWSFVPPSRLQSVHVPSDSELKKQLSESNRVAPKHVYGDSTVNHQHVLPESEEKKQLSESNIVAPKHVYEDNTVHHQVDSPSQVSWVSDSVGGYPLVDCLEKEPSSFNSPSDCTKDLSPPNAFCSSLSDTLDGSTMAVLATEDPTDPIETNSLPEMSPRLSEEDDAPYKKDVHTAKTVDDVDDVLLSVKDIPKHRRQLYHLVFFCKRCDYFSMGYSQIRTHVRVTHNITNMFTCSECESDLSNSEVAGHSEQHHPAAAGKFMTIPIGRSFFSFYILKSTYKERIKMCKRKSHDMNSAAGTSSSFFNVDIARNGWKMKDILHYCRKTKAESVSRKTQRRKLYDNPVHYTASQMSNTKLRLIRSKENPDDQSPSMEVPNSKMKKPVSVNNECKTQRELCPKESATKNICTDACSYPQNVFCDFVGPDTIDDTQKADQSNTQMPLPQDISSQDITREEINIGRRKHKKYYVVDLDPEDMGRNGSKNTTYRGNSTTGEEKDEGSMPDGMSNKRKGELLTDTNSVNNISQNDVAHKTPVLADRLRILKNRELFKTLVSSSGQTYFFCRHCSYYCRQQADMNSHCHRHQPAIFQCAYCLYTSYPRSSVTSHQQRHHIGKREHVLDVRFKNYSTAGFDQ